MLTSEQARQHLDQDSESIIALGINGGSFAEYAAHQLLSTFKCWGDTRYWILISAFNRKDAETIRIHLHDWPHLKKPTRQVHKFTPGDHYYALDEKFNSLKDAIEHLSKNGYDYGGLKEKFIYK